jgi:uncharacterized Zn-binding protein involved in type VI secretion
MAVAIARNGDLVQWHTTLAFNTTVTATTTKAFADNKAIAKVGDTTPWHLHWLGSWFPMMGTFNTGSTVDFVEGKGVLRVGDIASCGCWITAGSPDVNSV